MANKEEHRSIHPSKNRFGSQGECTPSLIRRGFEEMRFGQGGFTQAPCTDRFTTIIIDWNLSNEDPSNITTIDKYGKQVVEDNGFRR